MGIGAKAHCPVSLMVQPLTFPLLCQVLLSCQPTELKMFLALPLLFLHQLHTFSSRIKNKKKAEFN